MSNQVLRRSTRNRAAPAPAASSSPPPANSQPAPTPVRANSPPEEANQPQPVEERHKAVRGDRYKVPKTEFFDDAAEGEVMFAVVTERVRGSVRMWFLGDASPTLYRGYLSEWHDYYVAPENFIDADELTFQEVEMQAGIRARTLPNPRRRPAVESGDTSPFFSPPPVERCPAPTLKVARHPFLRLGFA